VRKIISLFERDCDVPRLVVNKIVPGAEWVAAGEGIATRKYDGTACLVRNGKLYKRVEWDAQKGPAPVEWLHHDFDPAIRSGHGWLPIGIGPEDWLHRLAEIPKENGTYELCGPKIQKNPEHFEKVVLVPHGTEIFVPDPPRTFDGLKEWFKDEDVEGIVWHHPDGRMVKIKKKDFGLKR
jgi:hypothetical protein